MPFKAQEIRDQGGVYYGQNVISKNLIIANRKELLNGNGFVLGVSGSGKSFTAKEEMAAIILSTEDDVIVIDPESEYYDKKNMTVRWPFGHGLSYTDFTLSNLRLSDEALTDGNAVTVSVDVTNTGLRCGKDVVQLYVGHPVCQVPRPLREFQGTAKVELAPGETKTVSMTLTARSVSYWEERLHDWYAPSGEYTVSVGHSSRNLPLETTLVFRTEKEIPLVVSADTCLGDIYRNPYAAAAFRKMMAANGGALRFQQENMDRTNDSNPGMMQAMIQYVLCGR